MKLDRSIRINKWLLPLSWLYGLVVYFRNKFFKWGIYKRKEYDIPIICVGNISVGGTGKTPHTEYLIRLLKEEFKVAVLSRGYKRKTNGFILSTIKHTSTDIGDEPFQIKQKFPEVVVAVDRNRCNGVEQLLALDTPPDVIILDDGFQHRHIKPSYCIILSDYNRPIYEDALLPAGRLREPVVHLEHANDIIITKCPGALQPIEYRIISHDINAYPFQGLYFTSFKYKTLRSVFNPDRIEDMELNVLQGKEILLVTGIASPKALIGELSQYSSTIHTLKYPDHHTFSGRDIKLIKSRFNKIKADNKIIIVTEKDAGRLLNMQGVDPEIAFYFYYIPIEVIFSDQKNKSEFDKKIITHVRKNSRDSRLH